MTTLTTLNIATRQSPLALWQAEHIQARLQALYPSLTVNLVPMVTQGDKILDTPLAKIGGKGLFVKELEQEFGDAFFRIHRNALINLNYLEMLEAIDQGQYQVCFKGLPDKLAISRRHLPLLRDKIQSM